MNNGTKIRTVLAIATCLNTALMVTDVAQFQNATLDLVYRVASVVLNFIVVACATWFDNNYTEEACQGTGLTRQLKAQKKEGYIGEVFTDTAEEVADEPDDI